MFAVVARFILRNRVLLLVILGVITLFMFYNATKVKLSYEYAQMLPSSDSAYVEYGRFKKTFGEEANVIIIGIQDSNLFQLEKFNDWFDLGDEIKSIKGIANVVSIARIINLQKNTVKKKIEIRPVFEKKPETQQELDSLVRIVHTLPFYKNLLYTDTGKIHLMLVTMEKTKLNSEERIPIIKKIKDKTESFGKKYNLEIRYSGMPYIRTIITDKIKKELFLFIILSVFVSIIILYLLYKSLRVVFFSILVVAIGVVWAMGSLSLLGYDITILTGLLPSLLIIIGISNSIFLLNKYHHEYHHHKNQIKAIHRVIQKIGSAIFLTNFTAAAGFAAFSITGCKILVEFGIVAFINIIAIFFLSLLLISIIFSFLAPPSEKETHHLDRKKVQKIFDTLIHWVMNKRQIIYITTIITIVVGIFGILFIKTNGYMVDDIPEKDKIYIDLKLFERHFGGVLPLEISIDTKKKKGVFNLTTLQKIDKLQRKLNEYPELSRSVSIAEVVKFATQSFYNGKESSYKLPGNMDKNFILSYVSGDKEKEQFLHSFIDSNQQIIRISVQMADVGTERMEYLINHIQTDINQVFSPQQYNTTVTGSSLIFFKGSKYLVRNLLISVLLAILFISLCMTWLFTSFRMILISVIPNIIPLILTAAIMGFFGIRLKPSSILIFSIAFGISIDNTIRFMAKYRQELKTKEWNINPSVIIAIREAGLSNLYTSIALFFGFAVFIASDFGGTRALGALISITLLLALLTNIILLPSMIISLGKRLLTKAFKEPLIQIFDEEEDIELEDMKIENNGKLIN